MAEIYMKTMISKKKNETQSPILSLKLKTILELKHLGRLGFLIFMLLNITILQL